MSFFYNYRGKHRRFRLRLPRSKKSRAFIALVTIGLLTFGAIRLVDHIYHSDLQAASVSQKHQVVDIQPGSSVKEIGALLQQDHLIKSAWAFRIYVGGQKLNGKLQAGSFSFAPNEDVPTIVSVLASGRTTHQLVTIYPGRRIDQIRAELINFGYTPSDVDQALNNISQYSDLPIISNIKPANVNTLEGLLWPDSWYKDANSSASEVIRQSLEETQAQLTPAVQAALASENLTPYQGLTLASIINQEVNTPSDQAQAAQVFLSRLKMNMKLGSDVTALYGSIEATGTPDLSYDSPYNTLLHTGLPPTPISTVNSSSLNAVTHPAGTNWLYFVTGDNGITYFSQTLQQHQAQTQQYCHKLCQQ